MFWFAVKIIHLLLSSHIMLTRDHFGVLLSPIIHSKWILEILVRKEEAAVLDREFLKTRLIQPLATTTTTTTKGVHGQGEEKFPMANSSSKLNKHRLHNNNNRITQTPVSDCSGQSDSLINSPYST